MSQRLVDQTNLVGRRFGALVVRETTGVKNGHSQWRCLCDCGRSRHAGMDELLHAHTPVRSCRACEADLAAVQTDLAWRRRLQRNRTIRELRRNGWSVSRLAQRFGLTEGRIYELLPPQRVAVPA